MRRGLPNPNVEKIKFHSCNSVSMDDNVQSCYVEIFSSDADVGKSQWQFLHCCFVKSRFSHFFILL